MKAFRELKWVWKQRDARVISMSAMLDLTFRNLYVGIGFMKYGSGFVIYLHLLVAQTLIRFRSPREVRARRANIEVVSGLGPLIKP